MLVSRLKGILISGLAHIHAWWVIKTTTGVLLLSLASTCMCIKGPTENYTLVFCQVERPCTLPADTADLLLSLARGYSQTASLAYFFFLSL